MASVDRSTLLAFFRSTGGTKWKQSRNWNTNAELSQWHGVNVNEEGRVVKLVLDNNKLKGALNPSFRSSLGVVPMDISPQTRGTTSTKTREDNEHICEELSGTWR